MANVDDGPAGLLEVGYPSADGQAYMERSGTHFHLEELAEAQADAGKACEPGISEGCMRARQVAGRLRR